MNATFAKNKTICVSYRPIHQGRICYLSVFESEVLKQQAQTHRCYVHCHYGHCHYAHGHYGRLCHEGDSPGRGVTLACVALPQLQTLNSRLREFRWTL